MRPCFEFRNLAAADDKPATLSIFDEIGFWGVQAKDFISALGSVQGSSLNVEINSPGGDVFAGLAIYNALKGSGKEIVVKVMGVAASAASLIAMAGDKIVMPKNTFLMVHNPWSVAMGNADELRQTADTLDKIGQSLKATYAAKTGLSDEELNSMLATDTWLTADEALAKGFATEVIDDVKASASFDMVRANLPENVKAVFQAASEQMQDATAANKPEVAQPTVAETIEAAAQAAQLGEFSAVWVVACADLEEANARIAQAKEINSVCAFAKRPEIAAAAIRAGKSVAEVRAQILTDMAVEDERTHTDASKRDFEQVAQGSEKPKVTTAALWASHKQARK
jgi:ATP-dependent Clp protease protease subunit